jgi:hypothetical protein
VALCASQPSHPPDWSMPRHRPRKNECYSSRSCSLSTIQYGIMPERSNSSNSNAALCCLPETSAIAQYSHMESNMPSRRGDEVTPELRCCQARYKDKRSRKCKTSGCGEMVAVMTDGYKGKVKEWRGLASMHVTETILGVQE